MREQANPFFSFDPKYRQAFQFTAIYAIYCSADYISCCYVNQTWQHFSRNPFGTPFAPFASVPHQNNCEQRAFGEVAGDVGVHGVAVHCVPHGGHRYVHQAEACRHSQLTGGIYVHIYCLLIYASFMLQYVLMLLLVLLIMLSLSIPLVLFLDK